MEKRIKVGHPFYFPTQVVLVDDDPDFLEGVSLMLRKDLSYRLFQSASQALDYVNQAHQQVSFLQRCYSNYRTGPLVSDSLSHIDIGKIHLEVLNGARFQTCSSVIVDYSMPEMNGLEFLAQLQNPYIKKVLLTGQADTDLAVKAFNRQLIDQFIDKHDPRLKNKLNSAINGFQDQYFRGAYKLITDPILANNDDAFLVTADFQTHFAGLREKLGIVEYYMIDDPQPGFLLVDASGNRRVLLIFTEQTLAEHAERLQALGAPADLRAAVSRAERLPTFDIQDDKLSAEDPRLQDWYRHYQPGMTLDSNPRFHLTVVSDDLLPEIQGRSIIPYGDFLQANCSINEIFH